MSSSRDPNITWEKVLQRILPSFNFQVSHSGSELNVRVSKSNAKEAAEKLSLAFSEQIQLPYQTGPSTTPSPSIAKSSSPARAKKTAEFPEGDFKRQLSVLESLISKNPVIKATGLSFSNLFTRSTGDSLATEGTMDSDVLRLYDGYRPIFNKALAKLTPEQINQAFEGKQALSTPQSSPIGDAAKHCAGVGLISGSKNHEQQLMVNLKNLYTLANAVPVNTTAVGDKKDEVELTIPIASFLLKLKQLLSNQGEMLISKQGEPIFFGIRDFIKPHLISLVLDRSLSMETQFPELQRQVIHFIHVLKERKLDFPVDVRVTFFAEQTDDVREFRDVCKNDLEFKALTDYVGAKHELGGSTRLNMSVLRELDHVKTQQLTKEKHVTMIVFTDGADNLNKDKAAEIKTVIDSFQHEETRLPLPTGFVLALGNEYSVDYDTLRTISTSLSKTQPMLLQNANEFAPEILNHLEQIESSSESKRIMWLVDGYSREKVFDLLHNNTAQLAPDVFLPVMGSFKLQVDNGEVMDVVHKTPELTPVAASSVKLSENNMWSTSTAGAAASNTFSLPPMRFNWRR